MKIIAKDGKLYAKFDKKDIGLTHWKFLGVEFTRIGEASMLKIFGATAYGRMGRAHFLLGLIWGIDKDE